jgi:hypothetical protein
LAALFACPPSRPMADAAMLASSRSVVSSFMSFFRPLCPAGAGLVLVRACRRPVFVLCPKLRFDPVIPRLSQMLPRRFLRAYSVSPNCEAWLANRP